MNSKKIGKGLVLSSLFGAVVSVSCFFHIPLPGGVPMVIQDMMAIFSGIVLGPVYGTASILIFIVLGCIGLPVFSGKAGFHVIVAGPTGGFIIGYLLSALVAGLFVHFLLPVSRVSEGAEIKNFIKTCVFICLAAILAHIVLYACGIFGFMKITGESFSKAFSVCVIPFIPGIIIKIIVLIALSKSVRPFTYDYLWQG